MKARDLMVHVVSLDDIAKAARQQAGLIAPAVPAAGETLGDIVRPHLVDTAAGTEPAPAEGASA